MRLSRLKSHLKGKVPDETLSVMKGTLTDS